MKELIEDTLRQLEPEIPYSQEAFELVFGTGAHESMGWRYRRQLGGGPARGLFQCEKATFDDLIENYLAYRPELLAKIIQISRVDRLNFNDLETNDTLAVCICRVHYRRFKWAIPKTLEGQAKKYKIYYNSVSGKATVEDYIRNYKLYSKEEII